MCFSPEASFTVGCLLLGGGCFTVRKALNKRDMLVFSFFPIVFGLHQIIEGMVWISLDDSEGSIWQTLYFSIAILFWPLVAPIATLTAEYSSQRRRILWLFVALGFALVVYFLWKLLFVWTEIQVTVEGHSLRYQPLPLSAGTPTWVRFAYAFVAIGSPLVSSRRMVQFLGVGVGIAFLITFIAMNAVYVSTWCMAAAVLSCILYFAIGSADQSYPKLQTSAAT
jgi:hypothetical protein